MKEMSWLPKRDELDSNQVAIDFSVAQEGNFSIQGRGQDGEVGRGGAAD